MRLEQKPQFQRAYKKLRPVQKKEVNQAIREIAENPKVGVKKIADLSDFRVYKFKINKREVLLAYTHTEITSTVTLYALGSHQNFYRDLKKHVSKN